jgi:hypothetical protein
MLDAYVVAQIVLNFFLPLIMHKNEGVQIFGTPSLIYSCYLLTALRVAAAHTGEASVLVCHILLATLWTLAL